MVGLSCPEHILGKCWRISQQWNAKGAFYVIPRILGYRKPSWLLKGMFLWRTWDPWAQLGQTGSAPPFPSARWGWNLPEASRSFTEDQHPLFSQPGGERGFQELPGAWLTRASLYPPSGGAGHGFSCSAPPPRIGGIKATLPQTQQDAGGILSGCTAPRRSFPVTRAESLGMSWLFMLWENRANAERRLGGASHSLNNESQPLPASHFFSPIPSPC